MCNIDEVNLVHNGDKLQLAYENFLDEIS